MALILVVVAGKYTHFSFPLTLFEYTRLSIGNGIIMQSMTTERTDSITVEGQTTLNVR